MNLAVLLIDMQPRFTRNVRDVDKIIPNQQSVLQYCAEKDVPVVLIEYAVKENCCTLQDLVVYWREVPRKYRIEKDNMDAFINTNLDDCLKNWNAEQLLLMGIYAGQCVMETALSALQKDFKIITAYDLIGDNITPDSKYPEVLWPSTVNELRAHGEKCSLLETHLDALSALETSK